MSAGESNGGFVQFPLCALAMPVEFHEIVSHGISSGICSFVDSLSNDEYEDGEEKLEHARRTIGFSGGDMSVFRSKSIALKNYTADFEARFHKTAFARIPSTYAFEIRDKEWPENEGRVFIAIASGIGQKPYTRLGWEVISWRAAGHVKSKYGAMLSRAKVDYAAKNLVNRGLLACYTYNKGVRYWSFPGKCSREQVARFVLAKVLKRQNRLAESDCDLTARLTAELTKSANNSAR